MLNKAVKREIEKVNVGGWEDHYNIFNYTIHEHRKNNNNIFLMQKDDENEIMLAGFTKHDGMKLKNSIIYQNINLWNNEMLTFEIPVFNVKKR